MPVPFRLRPIRPDDSPEVEAVVALNNGAVPAVNAITTPRLHELIDLAAYADVVVGTAADALAGFVLVLPAGAAYDSLLFEWFSQRYDRFLYLDRIVVDAASRRRGVGRLVYDTVEERARSAGRLLCEVNVEPPNPESHAFHAARGFVEVGRCTVPAGGGADQPGDKVCLMLAKELG